MGGRKVILVTLCLAVMFSGTMADVSARLEGRWALQAGDVITGMDFSVQKPVAAIFHQQTTTAVDLENLNLSFPAFADGLHAGLSPDDLSATSNILPFGPVSLAFPSIHEDALQSADMTSTGFVTANWAYIADTAAGNLGSEPIGTRLASGHPFKSPKMLGSEFLWPYMVPIGAASASGGDMAFDLSGLSLDPGFGDILDNAPAYHTPKISFAVNSSMASGDNGIRASNTSVTGRASGNASQPYKREPTRKPRVNPKATREEIRNMTLMQRMYRDAFVGSTMHMAYEGPTQYPTWIDPFDNGRGVFNQIDMQKILQVAHKKTLPGEHIAPVFWDI